MARRQASASSDLQPKGSETPDEGRSKAVDTRVGLTVLRSSGSSLLSSVIS